MKKVLLNNLHKQYDAMETEIRSAVERVLNSGWYILGEELGQFEKAFAAYCGRDECVGLANGTDALEMAMRAVDVAAGSEVVTVANAGMYSTTAILAIGAVPVFADIEEESQTICPQSAESSITGNTKALIVTHLYGQLADIETMRALADKYNVALIEDCAQSHGATRNGKKAGAWGDCAAFSFYPTKNLGALGDSGAVVTSTPEIANKIRKLRQYGWSSKYHVGLEGGRNSRLDELQAAILRVKLQHLDQLNLARRKVAGLYSENMTNTAIKKPSVGGSDYVAHLYVVQTDNRDSLIQYLKRCGIGSEVHYPLLDYQQNILHARFRETYLPVAEKASQKILTLPCYPEIEEEEVLYVCKCVNEWSI